MCLNSACYGKRMSDLSKTDIDQALEVCETWKRANRFRWAQEDGRRAGQTGGHAIARARGWQLEGLEERHGRRPLAPPLEPRRDRYHGHCVRSFSADDEGFDPRVMMDYRESPGGVNVGGYHFPPYNEGEYTQIIEITPRWADEDEPRSRSRGRCLLSRMIGRR